MNENFTPVKKRNNKALVFGIIGTVIWAAVAIFKYFKGDDYLLESIIAGLALAYTLLRIVPE